MPQATARITLPPRYQLVRHIANGGMASVWEAHDELLDRPVAIKVLAAHLGEDERARRRFAREARTAGGLSRHPHVVTVYDVSEYEGRAFIVMELLRGGTIADRIASGRPIDHAQALAWLDDAAAALDAAHEAGIVHRDVKPANMLLDDHGRLAIADFGIARLGLEDQITQTGQVLGTAAYLAPEQATGEPTTPASDRYAFAVVAFELLTGTKPFRAEGFAAQARAHVDEPPPPATVRAPDLPDAVDAVLDRGLAKAPEDRWPTAGAMVRALDDALAAPDAGRTAPTRALPPDDAAARRAAAAAAPLTRRAATRSHETAADAPARGRRGGAPPPGEPPRDSGSGSRRGAFLVVALVALVALCGGAAALLLGGGDDGSGGREQAQREPARTATPDATRTREPTPEPTKTAEPTATATPTPTPTPTPSPTPEPTEEPSTGGGGSGNDPTALQLRAFELNNSGDAGQALTFARKAVRLCEGSSAVDPCAYALFEYARALRLSGDPQGAIAALQERQQRFPDNQPGAVAQELARARADAG